jgi:hypothetical protein
VIFHLSQFLSFQSDCYVSGSGNTDLIAAIEVVCMANEFLLARCYSLIALVLSEVYRMIVVCSRQYISLCTKSYKYVKLLHVCVKYEKKNANEYLSDRKRKRAHQKTCKSRRTTIQSTNNLYDRFLHKI